MNYITWKITDQILHIIFPVPEGITPETYHATFVSNQRNLHYHYDNPVLGEEVLRASIRYEGANQFVGFNIPISVITPKETYLFLLLTLHPKLKYIISYLDGDIDVIEHELRHARFYIDKEYHDRVQRSWDHLKHSDPKEYQRIIQELVRKQYDPRVFMDEFQAYYPEKIK